jgi:acyl-CoA-binding protein
MQDLNQQFQDAVAGSKTLPSRPDNETMLKLYALYKQGTQGDAPTEAPGDMMGMFKHKAWAELVGLSKDEAQLKYVELVNSLRAVMG